MRCVHEREGGRAVWSAPLACHVCELCAGALFVCFTCASYGEGEWTVRAARQRGERARAWVSVVGLVVAVR